MTTQSVPVTERKVSRHITITAAKTPARIGNSLAFTSSLVAAITPTLPVASRNFALGVGFAARHSFTAATTRSMVSAR